MYLKKLELQGFKSFADRTTLEFVPGITAVIGPNGSGKSNIVDAIRWVLGEQSMKSLRGAKSEDVIFAGTQNRKSLGFAEVSLIIDNTDGRLPIEYTEVTITRRLYRSGESGYYINKVPCRLKDVTELFLDTGIGKDGYSIIGQGKIDEILSNKSEDRRHIFEEAAGIVKYRVRKEESEKKLEHTKLNLLRINDILSEVEANLEPLQIQSEKARKFLDLREELKNIEVGLFLYHIDSYKIKLEELKQDEEIMQTTYHEQEGKQERNKQTKERLKQEIDEMIEKIEEIQNLSFESTNTIEKIKAEIGLSTQRMENNKENAERYEQEKVSLEEKIAELEKEKEQKLVKKENLLKNREKFSKELQDKQEELEELTQKLSSKMLEIEENKRKVEENTDLKYEKQNEINTEQVNYQNLEKREVQLKQEIQSTISELDASRTTRSELESSFGEIESKKNKLTLSMESIKKQKEESNSKINNYEEQINKITYEMRMKDARLKFLQETEKEKEGYQKSVKSLLKDCEQIRELGKGMHGVLANILTAPKEYETAIEMCLGQALQNIVTESEEDAKRLVEHLRKNNLGRASFLPITSVKGRKIDKYDGKNIKGIIGIASELVSFDKKYTGIIENLLGRTIIVEDMDVGVELAKKNKYSFRIVTRKGDIINPSGAITGGSVNTKTVNILGRSREIEELEKQVKELKKKLDQIEIEKREYISQIEEVLEETSGLEKQLQEIEITYATEKQKLVAVEENVQKLENRLKKLKEEQQEIGVQKEQIEDRQKQIEREIAELKQQTEELQSVIEEFSNVNKDDQTRMDDLNFDITNLKISVSSFEESETSVQEMTERIEADIKASKESILNKEKQKALIAKENEELEIAILECQNRIETIKQEVQGSSQKIEELKKSRLEKNEKLTKTEEEINHQFEVLEDLKEQLVKMDVKKTKLEQDLEDVVNKMWEEYELTPNHAEGYIKPENVQTTQKQVSHIRNEMKELGSINLDSIEEYKQTKQRYDFMTEQKNDLENSIGKLRKVILDMTTLMKQQFEEKFRIINKNFNEVFCELFGGGKAELILTDEANILECGIEIQVQPPGKKLQNMTLLSGGEKAFTAIAILFAILKINPAPFCVLDEIEAALDDVNVYRYAEYLKKFTKEIEFLVITHRKGTMEAAETVYGITMEENGISKLLSMKLK